MVFGEEKVHIISTIFLLGTEENVEQPNAPS